MGQFLDDLKSKFNELRPDDAKKLEPCTEAEIASLESQFSITLPLAYREYLLWTGHSQNFISFTNHTYYATQYTRLWLRDEFSKLKPHLHLPEDMFVFAFDVSPMGCFFRAKEGDNPPVYIFIEPELKRYFQDAPKESWPPAWQFLYKAEAKKDFQQFARSFTEFLEMEMDRYIQSKERTEAWRASFKSK